MLVCILSFSDSTLIVKKLMSWSVPTSVFRIFLWEVSLAMYSFELVFFFSFYTFSLLSRIHSRITFVCSLLGLCLSTIKCRASLFVCFRNSFTETSKICAESRIIGLIHQMSMWTADVHSSKRRQRDTYLLLSFLS